MSEPAVDSPSEAPSPEAPRVPHAGVRYALLRVSMLLSVGVVLYAIGLRGPLLVVLAFLLSGLVSYFVLMRQRDAAAANLERQVRGWSSRHQGDDATVDHGEAGPGPDADGPPAPPAPADGEQAAPS